MSIAELQRVPLADFGGQWSRLDPSNVPADKALFALNCEFNPQQAGTRKGFATIANLVSNASAMFNWISAVGNYLVVCGGSAAFTPQTVKFIDLSTLVATASYTPDSSTVGAVITSGGSRVYVATFTTASIGSDQGRVCTTTYADKLFAGPLATKPTLGGSGAAGSVTPGLHRVGYIIQTRTGFTGRVSPVSASTNLFDTTSTVTTTAGQQIDFSITVTWPVGSSLVYPVMTTIDNLDRYFIVPGLSPVAVVGGVSSTVTFTILLSDADLSSVGSNVTDNNKLFTQDSGGAGPFNPFSVGMFGQRTVYLTSISSISQGYASEPDNAQQITADQHVFYLPGQREMRAQAQVGRVLYIAGPNWTYAFEDTGSVPVLWPPSRLLDGSIGTLSPHGFTVDASTGNGWCAHTTGLYYFSGGAFAQLPVSYYCDPDWKRINWGTANNPGMIQVVDNKDKQQVYVLAPLLVNCRVNTHTTAGVHYIDWVSGDPFTPSILIDNIQSIPQVTINGVLHNFATVTDATHGTLLETAGTQTNVAASFAPVYPTHILTFDYSNGTSPEVVKLSPWAIKSFAPNAIAMTQNPTSKLVELWVGQYYYLPNGADPPVFGSVLRQMNDRFDTAPYADNSLAIDCQWEGPLLPGMQVDVGRIYHHYAQQIRATGSGSLARTLYGLDRTKSQSLTALTLSATPGQAYTTRHPRLRSEGASCRFSMNAANQYFVLSGFDHFYSAGPSFQ